jgi:hypothetical protein
MVSSGKVKEAYDKYVHPDFFHHHASFKGDRDTLMKERVGQYSIL